MKFTEYLIEVFKSQQHNWEWTQESGDEQIAVSNLEDGRTLEVIFQLNNLLVKPEDLLQDHPELANVPMWEVVFEVDGSQDVTGEGNAYAIIATVFGVLNEFIQEENPEMLVFTAKEPSRKKLYRRIVGRYKGQADTYSSRYGGFELYYIVRRRK